MLILICWLLIWAFILSWISNIVLRDEVSIGTSFGILFMTGVVAFVYGMIIPKGNAGLALLGIPLNILVMSGLLVACAHAPFKKALIIACIYGATTFAFFLIVAMLLK